MADEPTEPTEPSPDQGLRGRDLIGLGGLLAGAVVVCTGLGLLLDRAADTTPVLTMLGVFVGMLVGALGFAVRVRQAMG
jgi:F0F1-type ATP synthase assembly protein I